MRDLQNRFMFDKTYGIITPFYSDGLGVTFVKELIKQFDDQLVANNSHSEIELENKVQNEH